MKMKFRIVLLVILAAVSECYGDLKCNMNPEIDTTCFQFWEQNQMIKMGQIPPECKDEVAKYDNAGPGGISQSDKDASKQVHKTDCILDPGTFWCTKQTFELQDEQSKAWEKVVNYGCVDKHLVQDLGLKLGCDKDQTRNFEVCLCDTDLCNDKNLGPGSAPAGAGGATPGAKEAASGEMKPLSLGAFFIWGIVIVSSVSLF